MIRILALDSRLSRLQEQRLLRHLPKVERQALKRFAHDADRHRSLLGHAAARMLIGQALAVTPSDVALLSGPYGKPGLAGTRAGQLEFSIAHSGDWVLVALARQAVGIDIEQEGHAIDPALIRTCFTPAEQRNIQTASDFYRYWTYKEAAIKAAGTGFTLDPARFEIVGGEPNVRTHGNDDLRHCHLARLPAPAGYSAAVATLAPMPAWTFDIHEVDTLLAEHADECLFLCNSSH